MKALRIRLLSGRALLLSIVFLAACGAPPPARQLLSVTVSPASGTAAGPAGAEQLQFIATGYYNTEPYTVTPLQAVWGANLVQKIATVTQDGLATCAQGAGGTTTVEAWVELSSEGPVCNVMDAQGRVVCGSIGGTAQLVCP